MAYAGPTGHDLLPAGADRGAPRRPRSDPLRPRMLACALDCFLVLIAASFVAGIIQGLTGSGPNHDQASATTIALNWVTVPLVVLAWWVVPVGLYGCTLGQRAFKLRVVDANAQPIGFARQLTRCGAAVVAVAPFCLGYVSAVFDLDRRSWVDKMTGTWIVDARRAAAPARRSMAAPVAAHATTPPPAPAPWDAAPAAASPPAAVPPVPPPAAGPEAQSEPAPPPQLDVALLGRVADALAAHGQHDAAAPLLDALWRRAGDPEFGRRAAWSHAWRGKTKQALVVTNELLARDSADPEALAARARALYAVDAKDDATAAAEHALRVAPFSIHALFTRCLMHIDAREFDAARELERRMVAISADDPDVLNARCELAFRTGDRTASVQYARRRAELVPDDVDAQVGLTNVARPKPKRFLKWQVRPSLRSARVQLPLILALFRMMPQSVSARRELRNVMRSFVLFPRRWAAGTTVAVVLVAVNVTVPMVTKAMLLAAVAASSAVTFVWHRRRRAALDPLIVQWIDYLADQDAVARAAKDTRRKKPREARVPAPGVLSNTMRCECKTLVRLDAAPAAAYAADHLVTSGHAGGPGIFVFTCPTTMIPFIGFDSNIVGDAVTLRRVQSLAAPQPASVPVPAEEAHAPGLYL